MYNDPIRNIMTPWAQDFRPIRVNASRWKADDSAQMLASILLPERAKKIKALNKTNVITFETVNTALVRNCPPDRWVSAIRFQAMYELRIYNAKGYELHEFETLIEALKDGIDGNGHEVKELHDVEGYLQSTGSLRSAAFHIADYHSTILIVPNLAYGRLHRILSVLPSLMPTFFADSPLTDWEKDLLKSLTEDTPTRFLKLVQEFEDEGGYQSKYLKSQLENFGQEKLDRKKRRLQNEIDSYDHDIRSMEQRLSEIFERREELCMQLLGFETAEVCDTSELLSYMESNKNVKVLFIENGTLNVEIKTPLSNYDPDLYEKYKDNRHSVLYKEDVYRGLLLEDGRLLMDAIFDTQEVECLMRGAFQLDFDHMRVSILDRGYYTGFTTEAVDNPHLTDYRCLGNNAQVMYDFVRKQDYVMTLATCVSIVGNLNFGEPHNVENYMRHLFLGSRNKNCIYIKAKDKFVRPLEAIAYLKAKKAG